MAMFGKLLFYCLGLLSACFLLARFFDGYFYEYLPLLAIGLICIDRNFLISALVMSIPVWLVAGLKPDYFYDYIYVSSHNGLDVLMKTAAVILLLAFIFAVKGCFEQRKRLKGFVDKGYYWSVHLSVNIFLLAAFHYVSVSMIVDGFPVNPSVSERIKGIEGFAYYEEEKNIYLTSYFYKTKKLILGEYGDDLSSGRYDSGWMYEAKKGAFELVPEEAAFYRFTTASGVYEVYGLCDRNMMCIEFKHTHEYHYYLRSKGDDMPTKQ